MEIAIAAENIKPVEAVEPAREQGNALTRVFERCVDGLYRFILYRVGTDRDAADDLLQQTCFEAARHGRPPLDEGECEAWLRGIARNLIRRHWRKRKRQAGVVSIEDAALAGALADDLESRPLPGDALVKEESVAQLLLAVTSLSAAEQGLVFAYYFDGRCQAGIARDLGVTEKSVEARLYRVRGRLRKTLRSVERSGGL